MALAQGLVGLLLQQSNVDASLHGRETSAFRTEMSVPIEEHPTHAYTPVLDEDPTLIVQDIADDVFFNPDTYGRMDSELREEALHLHARTLLHETADKYKLIAHLDTDGSLRDAYLGAARAELEEMVAQTDDPLQQQVLSEYVKSTHLAFEDSDTKKGKPSSLPIGLLGLGLLGMAASVAAASSRDEIRDYLLNEKAGRFLVYAVGYAMERNLSGDVIQESLTDLFADDNTASIVHRIMGKLRPDERMRTYITESADDLLSTVALLLASYSPRLSERVEGFIHEAPDADEERVLLRLAQDYWEHYASNQFDPEAFVQDQYNLFFNEYVAESAALPEGTEEDYRGARVGYMNKFVRPSLHGLETMARDDSRTKYDIVSSLEDTFHCQDAMSVPEYEYVAGYVETAREALAQAEDVQDAQTAPPVIPRGPPAPTGAQHGPPPPPDHIDHPARRSRPTFARRRTSPRPLSGLATGLSALYNAGSRFVSSGVSTLVGKLYESNLGSRTTTPEVPVVPRSSPVPPPSIPPVSTAPPPPPVPTALPASTLVPSTYRAPERSSGSWLLPAFAGVLAVGSLVFGGIQYKKSVDTPADTVQVEQAAEEVPVIAPTPETVVSPAPIAASPDYSSSIEETVASVQVPSAPVDVIQEVYAQTPEEVDPIVYPDAVASMDVVTIEPAETYTAPAETYTSDPIAELVEDTPAESTPVTESLWNPTEAPAYDSANPPLWYQIERASQDQGSFSYTLGDGLVGKKLQLGIDTTGDGEVDTYQTVHSEKSGQILVPGVVKFAGVKDAGQYVSSITL